jgi:outer membrane protein assembly factor BamB
MFQNDRVNSGYHPDVVGPKEGVKERWAVDVDKGVRSSPAIRDGVVYVGAGDRFYALDISDGSELWSVEADGPVDASPTITGEMVFFNSDPGTVYGVDTDTGSVQWRTATAQTIPPETPRTSSPTVVEESVYVGLHRGGIWSFERSTGTERWRTKVGGAVIGAAPAVVDSTLYTGHTDGEMVAINTTDGDIKWRTSLAEFVTCPPTVAREWVYVGASDGRVYELSAKTGDINRTFQTEFEPDLPGTPLRKINASPAIAENTLVIGSNDYHAYAWDLETGERQWRVRVGGRCYTAPAIADGVVYVGGISGIIHGLNLQTGEQMWSYRTEGEVRDSSVAVVDHAVSFGDSAGNVYLLETS